MASKLFATLLSGIVAMLLVITYFSARTPQVDRAFSLSKDWQEQDEPLYAVADLHGDYSKALRALRTAGLLDEDGYWAGRKATLVQLGDLMDRGPYSLDCINLFERLKTEARRTDGSVHTLLGNHELMNLEGQHQYVSRQELQRLIKDMEPESLNHQQQKEQSLKLWKQYLQPDYPLGKALRQSQVALLKGEGDCRTLFVHAGLLPGLLTQLQLHRTEEASPEELLQDLNGIAEGVLRCAGGICKAPSQGLRLLHDADGVLWYRGYAEKGERSFCPDVAAVLGKLKAKQMVVGHNVVSEGKPRVLCQKSLYMMDIGMSMGYLDADATVWKCHHGEIQILTG